MGASIDIPVSVIPSGTQIPKTLNRKIQGFFMLAI